MFNHLLKKLVLLCCILVTGVMVFSLFCLAEEDAAMPALDLASVNAVYREELTKQFGEELAAQTKAAMGSMADMFKFDVWIYQVEGVGNNKEDRKNCVDTVFNDYQWPGEVTIIPLSEADFGSTIDTYAGLYEEELTEVWGSDWAQRAKQAAAKYEDVEVYTKSYVVTGSKPGNTFSIAVNSPFGSLRTFELYEGVYIIVIEMKINL